MNNSYFGKIKAMAALHHGASVQKAVTLQQDGAAVSQYDETVIPQRDEAVAPQYDEPVIPQRDESVVPQRDETVIPQRDRSVTGGGTTTTHVRSARPLPSSP